MKTKLLILVFSLFVFAGFGQKQKDKSNKKNDYVIVIHGGAGNIEKKNFPEELEKKYKDKLQEALKVGEKLLENGKSAVEVVEKVIKVMEDSPLFNAGKGAVLNSKGTCELDASIMDGKTMNAGAVAGVSDIKNPIRAAKLVMMLSPHVMLSGSGASEFAKNNKIEIVNNKYFITDKNLKRWKKIKEKEKKISKHGTVGCVVLDKQGNLAAGTSTGGMTNKKFGRIGDSPIIGAGTYANNKTCAVSCTGHGEYFIRYAVAHDISALMEYKNISIEKAAEYVVKDKLVKAGGSGGIIAVDKDGNLSMTFNTKGMFRAYLKSDGDSKVLLFK